MQAKQSEHVLAFEAVTKEYPIGDRKLSVLKGIDFSVRRGDFVSIMGPSGSGKSTMLQLMGCLDRPSSGRIFIDGVDTSTLNSDRLAAMRSQKIGFVFQAFNLIPGLTALGNVEIALSIADVPAEARQKRARELLGLVGLSDRESHKPNELSGGEKQRVAIARALANDPAFLLADEPTGNLDSASGAAIMDFIHGLWRDKKTTVVLVTHEPVVASYAQRTIRVRDGKIESDERSAGLRGKAHDIKVK